MRGLTTFFSIVFILFVGLYFFVLRPEKYSEDDLYDEIIQRGKIRIGINTDAKPFGFVDSAGVVQGYDADLGRYIAQYILNNPDKVEFISVTPANRMMKVSTGDVDIVIAAMTITPQRKEIIDFSIPYDSAGQTLLVKSSSKITSIADLGNQNVGVIWGTTAEKNMLNLAPEANVIGFKSYNEAYQALKSGRINAITSDDTILSGFSLEDKDVKLLPKRYSREPYGIGFKKSKSTVKLKEEINSAIRDMKQKNVITRLHNKWLEGQG
ncbi:transporter substrate-binding domain-containing protein [bacterium]|nr:transporter substrate-binding domain-containing protein [bacterium]